MSLNTMRRSFHKSAKWILGVTTAAMLVTAFTGIGANIWNMHGRSASGGATDPVIATVNGMPITRSKFDQALDQVRQQSAMMGPQTVLTTVPEHAQALNQLITSDLFLQIAEARGITATSSEIDALRDQKLPDLRRELSLPSNASVQQINSALQTANGQTIDTMFPDSDLQPQVILQKYQQELQRDTKVTDQDVRAFYRQARVRHILIGVSKRTQAQAQAQAQALIGRLKAGASFTELAKQYSDDPSVKTNSAEDGWIDQSTNYVSEFKKAALALSPGQITPTPVYSPQFGYFIIQCQAVRDNLPKDYAKNTAKYAANVTQTLENQEETDALTAAQQSAKVVVIDPQLAGDREASLAETQDVNDPAKRNADLAEALVEYQKALPKATYSAQGEIHVAMAQVYQLLNEPSQEKQQLAEAVTSSADPQLNIMLGNLETQGGDTKDALKQYALASEGAYDNPEVHMELQQVYKQMKQPELQAKEASWMRDYEKRQQTAMAPPAGAGQTNIALPPAGKGAVAVTPEGKAAKPAAAPAGKGAAPAAPANTTTGGPAPH